MDCEVCKPARKSKFETEKVLSVRHWNESVFSFRTTRRAGLRFRNGEFLMLGLEIDGKPLLRAYSIASPNYEDYLEFLSIKVQDGALTSRLQHIKEGDEVLIGGKPVGTLVIDDLHPGDRLWLFGSGTGLAPYMSIVKDPETYTKFKQVIIQHSVRVPSELAYNSELTSLSMNKDLFGGDPRVNLVYYPTVTRDSQWPGEYRRHTAQIERGNICLDPGEDRAMICGSPSYNMDMIKALVQQGLEPSPKQGVPGHFVVERAFVE